MWMCPCSIFPSSLLLQWDVTVQLQSWNVYTLCLKSSLQESLKGFFMVLLRYLVTKCPC